MSCRRNRPKSKLRKRGRPKLPRILRSLRILSKMRLRKPIKKLKRPRKRFRMKLLSSRTIHRRLNKTKLRLQKRRLLKQKL